MSHPPIQRVRTVANLGCGPKGHGRLPQLYQDWKQLRVDIDLKVEPDIVGDLTDLSCIPSGSVDSVWAAHCIEHLYLHEVPQALSEICRILNDNGFALITVPDLQAVAHYITADRLHEEIYTSPAGGITPHDIVFGYGKAIADGNIAMAHKCGFTPNMMMQYLRKIPFGEVILQRKARTLELIVIASKLPFRNDSERTEKIAALDL